MDESQVHVPESFVALVRTPSGRLSVPREEMLQRYELCEDLATLLTEHCRTIHFRDGVDEAEVLHRVERGLCEAPAQVNEAEARWVVCRTAELIGWSLP